MAVLFSNIAINFVVTFLYECQINLNINLKFVSPYIITQFI